jgi:benzoyl-CoA reductase/2-hydroxyglutaryl-CoA dehydratase subunit BcrC/BadD/HgdB
MSLPRDVEGVRVLAERLAREHVAVGGKVVGYLTPCIPAEMIDAAGLRPMMLSGGAEISTALGDHTMEDLFDTGLRAVFERLLKGEFDYLSAIVLPRANDSAHRLYYYLCELKRTGEAKLPPVLLCDVVMTPDAPTRKYSIDALERLWGELKALGDSKAGDRELHAAIEARNVRTRALRSFVDRRRNTAGAISGAEALAVFAGARMLPGDAFDDLLAGLPERSREPDAGRIMICGSMHGDAGLHDLIEAAGAVVAGDFHAAGELSIGQQVSAGAPPLEALVDRHRADEAASRVFADPGARIIDFARGCYAEAAVFSYFPEEEALTWDYPEQKAALESIGVPVIRLGDQARPFDAETDRAAMEALIRGFRK